MSRAPACVQADYPVSRLTTVGTGGPARWFARPEHRAALDEVLQWAEAEGLEIAVVGLGSNLLVADEGYDGVVLRLAGELARIARDGERIVCGGGATLAAVVKRATGWGLAGIEFGCAIPGTAGGAVRMNAGAYGGELRDVLEAAVVVGRRRASAGAGPPLLDMTYRHSNLGAGRGGRRGGAAAAAATTPSAIRATVADMQRRRREAQPAKVRTFGSVWKNPERRRSRPGSMLEECGLKGFAVGRRPHLAGARELHRERRRRPVGGRGRADGRGPPPRARPVRVELEHEVQMLGPIALPPSALTGQDPPALRRTGWTCQRPTSTPRWCCAGARFAAPRAGAGWRCSWGRSRCCSCPSATGGSSTRRCSRSRT